MRRTASHGPWKTRDPYVSKVFIGYMFHVEFKTGTYETLITRRAGWRPTKRWAASVGIRRHRQYLANEQSYAGNENAYDVIDSLDLDRQVKQVKHDLEELTKET